jgi:hypothetical protein
VGQKAFLEPSRSDERHGSAGTCSVVEACCGAEGIPWAEQERREAWKVLALVQWLRLDNMEQALSP